MNEPLHEDDFFSYAVRLTAHRIRLADGLAALLVMGAVACVMILGVVMADHTVAGGLSVAARGVFRWGFLVVELGLAAWMLVMPLARRISDLYIARLLERANPSFRNDLTAALQLPGETNLPPETLEALRCRASRETGDGDLAHAVNLRGVKLAAILFLASFLGLGLYGLFGPKPMWDSLARALGDSRPAPTRTQILLLTPADGTRVHAARRVTFEALVQQDAGACTLHISRDGGKRYLKEDRLAMKRRADDSRGARYQADWVAVSARGDVRFYVTDGDATSAIHALKVESSGTIRSIRARYDWPAYTGRGVTRRDGGHIKALAGTKVTILAEANLPVRSASLLFEGEGNPPPRIMPTRGKRFHGTFPLTTSGRYCIRFLAGTSKREAISIWYDIHVLADGPPTVRLDTPGGDVSLARNDQLRLAGRAEDDFGLQAVELLVLRASGPLVIPLKKWAGPGLARGEVQAQIPVATLGAAGDRVTCFLQARDHTPKPKRLPAAKRWGGQVGKSPAFTVRITADDPQIAAAQKAREQAQQRAAQQKGQEDSSTADKPQAGESTATDSSQTPDPADKGQAAAGEAAKEGGKGETASDKKDSTGDESSQGTGEEEDRLTAEEIEKLLDADEKDAGLLETLQKQLEKGDKTPPNSGEGNKKEEKDPSEKQGEGAGEKSGEGEGSGEGAGEKSGEGESQGEGAGKKSDEGEGSGEGAGEKSGEGQGQGEGAGEKSGEGQGSGEGAGEKLGEGQSEGSGAGGEQGDDSRLARQQPESAPADSAEALVSIGRVLDEAARQIRDDNVDPALLEAMEMTPEAYRGFVEKYTERHKQAHRDRKTVGDPEIRERAMEMVGSIERQQGQQADLDADAGRARKGSETDVDLRESARERIAPEYTERLDAVLRELGTGEATSEE